MANGYINGNQGQTPYLPGPKAGGKAQNQPLAKTEKSGPPTDSFHRNVGVDPTKMAGMKLANPRNLEHARKLVAFRDELLHGDTNDSAIRSRANEIKSLINGLADEVRPADNVSGVDLHSVDKIVTLIQHPLQEGKVVDAYLSEDKNFEIILGSGESADFKKSSSQHTYSLSGPNLQGIEQASFNGTITIVEHLSYGYISYTESLNS